MELIENSIFHLLYKISFSVNFQRLLMSFVKLYFAFGKFKCLNRHHGSVVSCFVLYGHKRLSILWIRQAFSLQFLLHIQLIGIHTHPRMQTQYFGLFKMMFGQEIWKQRLFYQITSAHAAFTKCVDSWLFDKRLFFHQVHLSG